MLDTYVRWLGSKVVLDKDSEEPIVGTLIGVSADWDELGGTWFWVSIQPEGEHYVDKYPLGALELA